MSSQASMIEDPKPCLRFRIKVSSKLADALTSIGKYTFSPNADGTATCRLRDVAALMTFSVWYSRASAHPRLFSNIELVRMAKVASGETRVDLLIKDDLDYPRGPLDSNTPTIGAGAGADSDTNTNPESEPAEAGYCSIL